MWFKSLEMESNGQKAGMTILSLGIVLLAAYVFSRILKITKLPLITGYIFAGIIAGPYITGFLSVDDVERFRLVDDLALSFIAFTAGGALHLQSLKKKSRVILFNVALLTIVVFAIVYLFIIFTGRYFDFINTLSSTNITEFAILL
jgi:Kef-type K+ transport system membrane component KefB